MQGIIYLRTSTEEQNPENQLRNCKSLVDEDFELVEEKQSAFKDKDRPKFEYIKSKIKKGNCKTLICWDWDRLFRNQKKLVEFFKFCELYKCKIHSYNQRYFDDFYKIPPPFDEIVSNLVLNLMGWLAEDESKKKSNRVKLAVRNKNGVTKSYKGNKWGRKSLSTQKLNKLKEYHKQNPKATIRKIALDIELSRSVVHKYLQQIKEEKSS